MAIKLFTHTDLDGIGCAILAKLAFKDIDISYCNYDNIDKKVKKFIINKEYKHYNYVCITDISINKDNADLIENTHPDTFKNGFNLDEIFQLFDHHETSYWLNKYYWANVKETDWSGLKTSATKIFYEYLIYEKYLTSTKMLDTFVEKIRRYDTWLWKEKYNDVTAKQLNDLLYIYGRDQFVNEWIQKLKDKALSNSTKLFSFLDNELLILEQQKIDQYITKKAEKIKIINIGKYTVGAVFAEQYVSELGNKLSEIYPKLDFIIIIDIAKNIISYRTIKDNINLGEIAKVYGGGGHPKASGSPIDKKIQTKILDTLFK